MTTINARTLSAVTIGVLALALAACGGGGSSTPDATVTPVTPVTPPVVAPVEVVSPAGTLQITAGATNYVAGSLQQSIFDELNASRQAAGAGAVTQSALVDIAAQKHADYISAVLGLPQTTDNLKFMSTFNMHSEIPTLFTDLFNGADLFARLTKVGAFANGGSGSEVIGGAWSRLADGTAITDGPNCIKNLMNTVYHADILLLGLKSIGVGLGTDTAKNALCVVDLIEGSSKRQVAPGGAGSLIAFPGAGMTVNRTFYIGYEVPRPAPTLIPELTAGTPVIVNFKNADFYNAEANSQLVNRVTSFQLTDATGSKVDAIILSNTAILGGPNVVLTADLLISPGTVVLVPKKPLIAGVYTASFSADISSTKTVTKTWSFSTADKH